MSNENSNTADKEQQEDDEQSSPPPVAATFVIIGGGIVGLVLALALQQHCGITAEIYEKVEQYSDVGAGMGMYPNGLRVLRDINTELLHDIQQAGYPYLIRRLEQHDGSEIVTAEEQVLSQGDEQVQPLGIRRWKLQLVLYEYVQKCGIPIHFGKRVTNVTTNHKQQDDGNNNNNGLVQIEFDDGTVRRTKVLFGADGSKSVIRQIVTENQHVLQYTGVTCLMGMAECARPERGLCSPTSYTTQCHAAFFPTNPDAQCFQFHFPIDERDADPGNWGTLTEAVGKEECHKLAERLRVDGWHEKHLEPLEEVTQAVRIGFCKLEPRLEHWVFGKNNNVILVGDAAHPPVPYTGQGAQMGLEDVGILTLLLKHFCCCDDDGSSGELLFRMEELGRATKLYERMRIPRTTEVQQHAHFMGHRQQKMADSFKYNIVQQELLQRQVFYHETLPEVLPGAQYDYKAELEKVLEAEKKVSRLPVLVEEKRSTSSLSATP